MIQKTVKTHGFMAKAVLTLIMVMSVPVYAVNERDKDDEVSIGDFVKSCTVHIASGVAAAGAGCVTFVATGKNGTAPAVVASLITLAGTQVSTRAMSKKSLGSREDALGILPGLFAFAITLFYTHKSGYLTK